MGCAMDGRDRLVSQAHHPKATLTSLFGQFARSLSEQRKTLGYLAMALNIRAEVYVCVGHVFIEIQWNL